MIMRFTKHRDIKCRQNSVIILGNLCSNQNNTTQLYKAGALHILVSFSFPPVDMDTTNAQFQSIAGVRGIAMSKKLRATLVKGGCIEPLILAAGNEGGLVKDIEVRREGGAALYNLALSLENGMEMAQSGAVSALISLIAVDDKVCQVFAIGTLANLAERESIVQSRLINDGCLAPLINHIKTRSGNIETEREVSRCLALFAYNIDSHEKIMCRESLNCIVALMRIDEDVVCQRLAAHAIANLGLFMDNHSRLIEVEALDALNSLVEMEDIETKRCVAFAFHNFCKNERTHEDCEKTEVARSLSSLLKNHDEFTKLHSCLALRYLTTSTKARAQFVDNDGLPQLLRLATDGNGEQKREAAAALRNLSISDRNKIMIMKEKGMEVLADFCRSPDQKLCHQACGVIANLAEAPENQELMMKEGILHHLKFFMRSNCTEVLRESLRAIANLSSDFSCTDAIASGGGLTPLVKSLSSDDSLCRRFATMSISNLATNPANQDRIVDEGGIEPLLFIASNCENNVDLSRRHAFFALTNLSASPTHQATLVKCGIIELCCTFLDGSDYQLKLSAALCISNLASSESNHSAIEESKCIQHFIFLLDSSDRNIRLRAVSFLRGLSANNEMRDILMHENIVQKMLRLATAQDVEIQIETLATLCNISLGGYIGDNPEIFIQRVDMQHLVSFLCSSNATCRLFGAVSIGNIASSVQLQKPLLEGGSLNPLIEMANIADLETQRCIAYALCNLCAEESNRVLIVQEGGLIPLFSLACSEDENDILTAVSAIRGLANSTVIQREIVAAGGLEPLFTVLILNQNKNCAVEAVSAIATLSLNDDNKSSIVNYVDFTVLLRDTILNNNSLANKAIRTLANCCENPQLHAVVVEAMEFNFMDLIEGISDTTILRELSRFYANLCSNYNLINNLTKLGIPEKLLDMLKSCDEMVIQNVVLGLLNLSTEDKYYKVLVKSKDLPHVLLEYCRSTSSTDVNIKIRRYACLAIGNFIRRDEFFITLYEAGVVEILLKNLHDPNDFETQFNASFGLHQLSMRTEIISELKNTDIEAQVLGYMSNVSHDFATHAISALRFLSLDDQMSERIVDINGLAVLKDLLMQTTEKIKREIAATFCHLTQQAANKLRAAKSIILGSIIDLSDSFDSESARFSIAALANIAEDPSSHDIILSNNTILSFFGKKMKSRNIGIKREASRAVSNLLTSKTSHKMFFDANGLNSIQCVSQSLDKECQYSIALSMNKLSTNFFYHNELLTYGALHIILNLAKLKNNLIAARQAASALRRLSSNREFKVSIANEGGMQLAVDLLYSDDVILKILAAGTLQHLSISSRLKYLMCSAEMFKAMTTSVLNTSNENLLLHCAGTFSNISEHPKARELLWEVQVVDSLVAMAQFPDPRVQAQTVRVFSFISSVGSNRDEAMELKIMEAAISLLSSPQNSIASDAATTIGNIATDISRQKLLCKLGVFEPLTFLIESTTRECHFSSCRALSRMMLPDENKLFCVGDEKLLHNLVQVCFSQSVDVLRYACMAICNLSSCEEAQSEILEESGVEALLLLTKSPCEKVVNSAVRALCNLGMNKKNQDRIVNEGGIRSLYSVLRHDSVKCVESAVLALGNLCSGRQYNKAIISSGSLYYFSAFMKEDVESTKQTVAAQIIYNLSTSEDCHVALIKASIVTTIISLSKSNDTYCRQYSMMTLCNLSANKITRHEAIKGGGLQSAVLMLKDVDDKCKIYACICLANMANNLITQNQVILHGGLPPLTKHLTNDNYLLQQSAIMCLVNLAGNESNCNPILRQGTFKDLTEIWPKCSNQSKDLCAFAISNLLSNDHILDHIGQYNGIPPLLFLAKSDNDHCKCISITSLRRLAISPHNRKRLMESGILKVIQQNGLSLNSEIQREVAAILCNLSRDACHRTDIFQTCLHILIYLIKSKDADTISHAAGTLGNLLEDDDHHSEIDLHNTFSHLMKLLTHETCDVRREVSRVISNLLSSYDNHESIIERDCSALVELSGDNDQECQHNAVLSCRKLVVNKKSHSILMLKGLKNFFSLLKSGNTNTKRQVSAILRDLSANSENKLEMASLGGIEEMILLLKSGNRCFQTFAAATLRHLSWENSLRRRIVTIGTIPFAVQCISGATQDLMCQIAGLFANLSEAVENHHDMVDEGVITAVLTLSRERNNEIIQDVARTLTNISASEDKQLLIHQQGGTSCLMYLSEVENCVCRRYVSLALQILSTNAGVCRALIKEKNVVPIVKLSRYSHLDYQRTTAVAVASISNEDSGKIELSSNEECLNDLFVLCKNRDIRIQRDTVCAIANISNCYDTHRSLLDAGALQVFAKLCDSCSDSIVCREIARFFSFISISDEAKAEMLDNGILLHLMQFARRSDIETQRYSSLALCNLCLSRKQKTDVLQHHGLVKTLLYLTRCPDLEVDRCTVLAITALALGADDTSKERIVDSGALKPLLKILAYPDFEVQQCASLALSALVLGEKEAVKVKLNMEQQSLDNIIALVNSSNEECIHHGIHIIGSLMESCTNCNILVDRGCIDIVTRITVSASIEIKRACGYIFSLLVENREYHEHLNKAGALQEIVNLAALVDLECQLYGAFSLVYLASNHDFQVPLVQMGAVRPLVAMMATKSEPRHYAGLALLKLADNFENHITIAEEGGIQALLKLGRNRSTNEEIKYGAALSVGRLASNAAATPKNLTSRFNNDNVIGTAAAKYRTDS